MRERGFEMCPNAKIDRRKSSRERLEDYLACDCNECRVAMSNDAAVQLFARLLLIAPAQS